LPQALPPEIFARKSNNFSQPLERARCGGKVYTVKPVTLEVFSDYV